MLSFEILKFSVLVKESALWVIQYLWVVTVQTNKYKKSNLYSCDKYLQILVIIRLHNIVVLQRKLHVEKHKQLY